MDFRTEFFAFLAMGMIRAVPFTVRLGGLETHAEQRFLLKLAYHLPCLRKMTPIYGPAVFEIYVGWGEGDICLTPEGIRGREVTVT